MQNFDIAIVGFGPVGAAAANMFAQSGFNIIVLEPKHEIWDIPRAVHFDGQTQRIFQSMEIFDQIQETSKNLILFMQQGFNVILNDAEFIYDAFFDVFNQNFKKNGKSNYARVSLGLN